MKKQESSDNTSLGWDRALLDRNALTAAGGLVTAVVAGITLRGLSPSEVHVHPDPIPDRAYCLSLVLFVGMP